MFIRILLYIVMSTTHPYMQCNIAIMLTQENEVS